ncbi:MAG: hypothetical protein R2788_06550 [Saprospiraceae bacterium]
MRAMLLVPFPYWRQVTPPYEYSLNGTDFQLSPDLTGLAAGTYTVYVRDSRNCIYTIEGIVNQPPPLTVEAGPDQTVDLGFTANINAVISLAVPASGHYFDSFGNIGLQRLRRPNGFASWHDRLQHPHRGFHGLYRI